VVTTSGEHGDAGGKKNTAQRIVYGAFTQLAARTPRALR